MSDSLPLRLLDWSAATVGGLIEAIFPLPQPAHCTGCGNRTPWGVQPCTRCYYASLAASTSDGSDTGPDPSMAAGEGGEVDGRDLLLSASPSVEQLSELISEVLAEHIPRLREGAAIDCLNPLAIETVQAHCFGWPEWREHVSRNIATRIRITKAALPQPVETGHDIGLH